MRYTVWVLLALAAYTAFPPLIDVATRDIPSDVAAVVANLMLVVGGLVLVVLSGEQFLTYLTHESAPYMYLGGVFLAIGILAYYRALALGPVSTVTPIFGLFIVTSSVLSILFLDESLTAKKGLGIVFAALAIALLATE